MSSQTRPPWLKKLKRIIGRRLRSGSLTPEAARQLCDKVLPSIQRHSPPPTVTGAADVWRADPGTTRELERFIGECYRSEGLGPEDAVDLFDELLPQARPGSIYALTQLLITVARAPVSSTVRDGPVLAVSMFNRMARKGTRKVAPNIATNTILISCCCDAGCLNHGLAALGQIFKTGLRADAVTFTPLLRTLCAEKRTSDAMNIVIRRMPELGCNPNVFSYTTLLKGLCDEKRCEEAVELIHMMAEDGDNFPPNAVSYNTVIDGFFKEGEIWKADHHIFSIQINAYCKCGMVDKAMLTFNKMQQQGLMPNIVSYGTIIDGLCKIGRLDDAMSRFCQMIDDGLPPSSITYSTLIHGFSMHGKWEKAEELFYEMMDRGIPANVIVFNSMMDRLFKEGQVTEARKLFDLMPRAGAKPDVVTYTTMIHGYFLAGEVGEVIKLLDDMLLIGLKPDAVAFNTLLDGMVSMGLKLDVVTCKTMIASCFEDGRIEDILTLFKEMLSKGR